MKIKMLALILALATITCAQTNNPPTPDKATAPAASSTQCACCDKAANDSKDMPCCHGKDAKGEMACCKENAKDAKACMRVGKDAVSCCGKDMACGKESAGCCDKAKTETAAKGCCSGAKCDRHAHQHASDM
jgi:hypothetical protein